MAHNEQCGVCGIWIESYEFVIDCNQCGKPVCIDCSTDGVCHLCATLDDDVCPECKSDDIVETFDGVWHCINGHEFS
jgi:hypothetical protein